MIRFLLRRAARAQYERVLDTSIVVPRDEPRALSGRPDALRVLLLGSGVASGHGVSTYGLALVGALQRSLQLQIGHAVDVELVRQHGAGIVGAAERARLRAAESWDAYVLAFGVNDALRMTPVPVWRRELGLLLATIDDVRRSPLRVPVVVAGVPPLRSFAAHRGVLMPALARHAELLNRTSRALLAQQGGADFAPLPQVDAEAQRRFGSPAGYERWASTLAARLAPALRAIAGSTEELGAGGAVELLLAARAGAVRERLHDLADEAQRAMSADWAGVRLVDGEDLVVVADSLRSTPRRTPIARSICATTLSHGALVLDDVVGRGGSGDPEIAAALGIRAYAGVALRAVDGRPIGTLCALNGDAGADGQQEVLHRIAAAIELELLRLGGAHDSPPEPPRPAPDRKPEPSEGDDRNPSLPERLRLLTSRPRLLQVEGARLAAVPAGRPRPIDPRCRVAGPEPIRVLMTGGDYSVGWGVRERADALDGALARLLHRRTGRGVDVLNRAGSSVALAGLAASLGPEDATEVDLVVWTPAFRDATRVFSRAGWAGPLTALIRRVHAESHAGVVLMEVPELRGTQPLAVLGRARARSINRVLRRIARHWPDVVAAPAAPVVLDRVATADGAAIYRATAVRMLPAVLQALGRQRTADVQDREDLPADSTLVRR